MSFQFVFDKAETMQLVKRPMVYQTVTRSNVVRSVSRGGDNVWRFIIKLPDGLRWSTHKSLIQAAEALGTHTASNITFSNTGYTGYMLPYNGITAGTTFNVICTQFPQWTIFQHDMISWDSEFIFYQTVA